MKTPAPRQQPLPRPYYVDGFNIYLASGIPCPHCGRGLRADDIMIIEGGTVEFICMCGRDILMIKPLGMDQ